MRVLKDVENRSTDIRTIWSFKDILPCDCYNLTLGEGWTPIVKLKRVSELLGLRHVYLKNEAVNPNTTFIDRGASIDVCYALRLGFRRLAVAAVGDFAISITSYCSRIGMDSVAVIPKVIERSKLYRMLILGARIEVEDSYEKAVDRVFKLYELYGYYPSIASAPTVIDGYRTIVFELFKQVKEVDAVIVPVGDGVLATSIYKGFAELCESIGFNMPRIIIVQLSSRPSIALHYSIDKTRVISISQTRDANSSEHGYLEELFADVAIEKPLAAKTVLMALEKSNGFLVLVPESQCRTSSLELARLEGIFLDPIGALSYAALKELVQQGLLEKSDRIVLIATGSPSKDPLVLYEVLRQDKKTLKILSRRIEDIYLSKTKIEILRTLAEHKMLRLYEIKKLLEFKGLSVSLPTIHHHISQLVEMGLVADTKANNGTTMYRLTKMGLEVLKGYIH